jgi:carbon monoxide dehydrogenase subunit G
VRLEHRLAVTAPVDRVWVTLMDLPRVAACVPGTRDVTPLGGDRYRGHLRVGVGPIRLSLEGEIEVTERDDAARRAVLVARGTDARLGGGVRARMTITATTGAGGGSDGGSVVAIDSDVQVLGRLGELGQPLMRRKADEVIREFAENLANLVGATA